MPARLSYVVFFLVYVSSAIHMFSPQDLVELLAISRRNNEKVGITGLLLYKDGNFMQFLEGPEDNVLVLMDRVKRDPRHHGVLTLLQGNHEKRYFEDWSMGFKNLGSDAVADAPGYSDFLNVPLNSDEFKNAPTKSLKLLMNFKRMMR